MAQKGTYIYEWPRPMVTVDTAIFCNFDGTVKLLLILRKKDPYKDRWALPGGFLELDEELETCAARELQEETGLTGVLLEQIHTFGRIGRDPRGRCISPLYAGQIEPEQAILNPGDDAADAGWFPIDQLPSPMAFDHDHAVQIAIEWMEKTCN